LFFYVTAKQITLENCIDIYSSGEFSLVLIIHYNLFYFILFYFQQSCIFLCEF